MKWPWVSRDSAERMIAFHQADAAGWKLELELANARAAADVAHERDRYDALLEKFTALRVAGAVRDVRPGMELGMNPDLARLPQAPADELRDLIHERAGGDMKRLGLMLAQLRRDRADEVSEDEIRQRIETGVQSDGVPA